MNEFEFIETLKAGAVIRKDGVNLAIGDDAAVFTPTLGKKAVVSTDMLVEGVHFIWKPANARLIGRKAMAVNLSDMAAMGSVSRETFLSVAKPQHISFAHMQEIYRGMQEMAHQFNTNILGGDTTKSPHDLVINVTVYGEAAPDKIITRGGGKDGDILLVTDYLGDAKAGLDILLSDKTSASQDETYLLAKQLDPMPCVAEGCFLAASGVVTAMIDLSDGLSSDIRHICKASNVGAVIQADKLPFSPQLRAYCQGHNLDPLQYALTGGDDYFLLLAAQPAHAVKLAANFKTQFNRPLYPIGYLQKEKGVNLLQNNKLTPLESTGWDHFR